MNPETKQELRALALKLAGLNTQAHDLIGSCPEHRDGGARTDCEGCAPLVHVAEQITITSQRLHFVHHAAQYSDYAAELEAPEVDTPKRRLPAWLGSWRYIAACAVITVANVAVVAWTVLS